MTPEQEDENLLDLISNYSVPTPKKAAASDAKAEKAPAKGGKK